MSFAIEMTGKVDENKANNIIKNKIIRSLFEVASVVEANVKNLTPVDTSRLVNSIHGNVDEANLTADVSTDVEYAPYVEFRQNAAMFRKGLYGSKSNIVSIFRRNGFK